MGISLSNVVFWKFTPRFSVAECCESYLSSTLRFQSFVVIIKSRTESPYAQPRCVGHQDRIAMFDGVCVVVASGTM